MMAAMGQNGHPVGHNGHPVGRRKRVVIIGGGIAGLSAAEVLARSFRDRFSVTVMETKRVTGGRAGSFIDPANGETVDYCQHVAMGCCTNLLALLQRCGMSDLLQPYRELTFLHPTSPPSRFAPSRWLPAPFHLANSIDGLRFLDRQCRREIRRGIWRLFRTDTASLRDQRAGDWLRANGQSATAIESFWDVILVSALGAQTEAASMAAARKVIIDGFAAATGAADVLIPNQPLSVIFGEQLPQALRAIGVPILTATSACHLAMRGGKLVGVAASSGDTIPADHVIAAVPWYALGRLVRGTHPIPELQELDRFANIPASPITGVHLWFDREITELRHAVLVGTTAQWLFRDDARRGRESPTAGPDVGYYYQVVISGSQAARKLGRERLVSQILSELQSAFPAARTARLLRSRVVNDPQAIFAPHPEVDEMRPGARTSLPNFHLAGDWIQTGWPSTMEGAVIGGRMAAASVLESERLPTPPIDRGLPRSWLAQRLIRA